MISASAVVFAYHDIGVRCLEALQELGVKVKLVVTHQDDQSEEIWFASVKEIAERNGIPVISPINPNTPAVITEVTKKSPQFIFSFYYRQVLCQELLDIPTKGAFNVHGSLLPKYRGRVPVNWAIIHGENESGVSLHRMVSKPDAGNLFAQHTVPILRNDTAFSVFQKLKYAAESMLLGVIPDLVSGCAQESALDLSSGSYFSGRTPKDGIIDWTLPAWEIHNLIRAVAPPYPGAFFYEGLHRIEILGSYFRGESARFNRPCLYYKNGALWADCMDARRFLITEMRIDGSEAEASHFKHNFGDRLRLPMKTK